MEARRDRENGEAPGCVVGKNERKGDAVAKDGSDHIDRTDGRGAEAAGRLETERVAWLTTVAADGTPQTSPVWFLWEGAEFLVYSLESARVRNVTARPRVSLNLDGDGQGGAIVVVEGEATVDRSRPSAANNPSYLAKYRPVIDDYGWTPEWFAERYRVPIRIRPTRYRYW